MRRTIASVALVCAALALTAGVATATAGKADKKPHVCKGTSSSPGTLSGTFKSGVVVKGVCYVDAGPAKVIGLLKLTKGSALGAAFGGDDSHLTVDGNVLVQRGATLVLGCNTTSFTCSNETNMAHPTLTSFGRVTGNLIASSPLGVLVHSSRIFGNVIETRGGGGVSCNPKGVFASFHSPVYSDYEDSRIDGNVSISDLQTCWLGLARVHVGGNVTLLHNRTADPDAIEVLSNHIHKNLVCRKNSHPSGMPFGDEPVWDSAEDHTNATGQIFPRTPLPNTVKGNEIGQCSRSTPLSPNGPRGPKGSF